MRMSDEKRRKVDWEKVEAEFRAGDLSIREIAKRHGISDTAIRKKAKGWDKGSSRGANKGCDGSHGANPGAQPSPAKLGRPSKYDPSYCEEVIAYMAQGYSLAAFAGKIGVARSRINDWMEAHEDFREAVSQAKGQRLVYWEQSALRVAQKGGGPGTATIIMFGLKNMGGEDWAAPDRTEAKVDLNAKVDAKVEVSTDAAFGEFVRALEGVARSATANPPEAGAVAEDGAPEADSAS